jgi:hypothetical protein
MRYANARGLAESGSSLYAAGWENSGGKDTTTVWQIDGSTVTPIALTDGTRHAAAWGIAAIGSGGPPVLYAAGYEGDYGKDAAMAWKIEGSTVTPIPLTGGTRSTAFAVIAP